ncbi:MAG: flagellar hook-length control protein FliK [SAR324 cluster bacterium]|nr:flagellar hook-length control protein FliK [SAR324 cluster bacterium]
MISAISNALSPGNAQGEVMGMPGASMDSQMDPEFQNSLDEALNRTTYSPLMASALTPVETNEDMLFGVPVEELDAETEETEIDENTVPVMAITPFRAELASMQPSSTSSENKPSVPDIRVGVPPSPQQAVSPESSKSLETSPQKRVAAWLQSSNKVNHNRLPETSAEAEFSLEAQENSPEMQADPRVSIGQKAASDRATISIGESLQKSVIRQAEQEKAIQEGLAVAPKKGISLKEFFHRVDSAKLEEMNIKTDPALSRVEPLPTPETQKLNLLQQQQNIMKQMFQHDKTRDMMPATTMPAGMAGAMIANPDTMLQEHEIEESEFSLDSVQGASNELKALSRETKTHENTAPRKVDSPFDLEQIVSRVNSGNGDPQEITMELNPEHLGKLTMKVMQDGDNLSVEMRVDNPMAKQMIEASMNDLKNRFIEKDFSFSNFNLSVNIDQRSNSQFQQSPNQGGFAQDHIGATQSNRLEREVPVMASIRRPSAVSGLSLYA